MTWDEPAVRARFFLPIRFGGQIMKKVLLVLAVVVLYILHQDFWFWRTAYPLVFGFMPIGLFYHGAFAVAAALLMWLLVKFAWPAHLEEEVAAHQKQEDAAS